MEKKEESRTTPFHQRAYTHARKRVRKEDGKERNRGRRKCEEEEEGDIDMRENGVGHKTEQE